MTTEEKNSVRKSKKQWVAIDGKVRFLTCYECAGNDMWWVPEAGYSLSEVRLFNREKDALNYAIEEAQDEATEADKTLQRLKDRRLKCQP